jgi:hypothetical protein
MRETEVTALQWYTLGCFKLDLLTESTDTGRNVLHAKFMMQRDTAKKCTGQFQQEISQLAITATAC